MLCLVDAQLPPVLARWMTSQGHEAEHVCDCGLLEGSDADIWQRALDTRAVIVTMDADFAERRAIADGPVIIWVRFGNISKHELLKLFHEQLPFIVTLIEHGEVIIELR